MRIAPYCRVSTDKADQLNSLEMQKKFYGEFAERNNHEITHMYADEHVIIGASAENLVTSRGSALAPFHFFVKGKYKFI